MDAKNPDPYQDDNISLLDFLGDIAEHFWALVLIPLFAGALAYGVSFLVPREFTSIAYLQMTQGLAESAKELIRTPIILDDLTPKFVISGGTLEAKRRALADKITVVVTGTGTETLVRLEIRDEQPTNAQEINKALIQQLFVKTKPGEERRVRIESDLQLINGQLKSIETLLSRLEVESTQLVVPGAEMELASPQANLLTQQVELTLRKADLERELSGISRDVVLLQPTQPTESTFPRSTRIAAYSALATGVAVLFVILAIGSIRRMSQDPETAPKIARIRRAFRPRRAPR